MIVFGKTLLTRNSAREKGTATLFTTVPSVTCMGYMPIVSLFVTVLMNGDRQPSHPSLTFFNPCPIHAPAPRQCMPHAPHVHPCTPCAPCAHPERHQESALCGAHCKLERFADLVGNRLQSNRIINNDNNEVCRSNTLLILVATGCRVARIR